MCSSGESPLALLINCKIHAQYSDFLFFLNFSCLFFKFLEFLDFFPHSWKLPDVHQLVEFNYLWPDTAFRLLGLHEISLSFYSATSRKLKGRVSLRSPYVWRLPFLSILANRWPHLPLDNIDWIFWSLWNHFDPRFWHHEHASNTNLAYLTIACLIGLRRPYESQSTRHDNSVCAKP